MKEIKLMFIDVRKAHLNAKCEEEEWVELPEEMWKWGRYAKLRRWLYGMRKAASGWEEDYAEKFKAEGFERGRGAPTVFWNKTTKVRVVVHGDDFTMSGEREELEEMRGKMQKWYEIKDRGIMGSGLNEIRKVTILGRTVTWTAEGIEYEADEKHRKTLMKNAELEEDSKAAAGPVVKIAEGKEEEDEKDLEGKDKTEFRGNCALLNYLGQDRSDIQFATNQICRRMSRPTEEGMRKIKRVVRYLVGAEKVVWKYEEFKEEEEGRRLRLDVHIDSDWAGGGADRKSTSGGIAMLGGAAVKHWSRTQKTRAMSSGEAEYYALVTGCAEALGMKSVAEDMGFDVEVTMWTDSTAGKSVASRRGLGKMRHVELKYLWVQDIVKEGRLRVKKVAGVSNIADHLTKAISGLEMARMLRKAGGEIRHKHKDEENVKRQCPTTTAEWTTEEVWRQEQKRRSS